MFRSVQQHGRAVPPCPRGLGRGNREPVGGGRIEVCTGVYRCGPRSVSCWSGKQNTPIQGSEASKRGVESKPGRQSEDDHTPRGIFKNSSVGLCRDSRELNNGALENCWYWSPPEALWPRTEQHRKLHPTSKNPERTSISLPFPVRRLRDCAGNAESDASGSHFVQVFLRLFSEATPGRASTRSGDPGKTRGNRAHPTLRAGHTAVRCGCPGIRPGSGCP